MSVQTFNIPNAAVALFGSHTLDSHDYLVNNESAIAFKFTGTQLDLNAYFNQFAAPNLEVTLDATYDASGNRTGGSVTEWTGTDPGSLGFFWYTLLAGLSDATHEVTLRRTTTFANATNVACHITAAGGIRVTGSAPALALPSARHNQDALPLVVCDGDSRTMGYGLDPGEGLTLSGNSYPALMLAALPGWVGVNQGQFGNTAANIATQAPADIDTQRLAGRPASVYVWFAGINDIFNGSSLATVQTATLSACNGRRAAGYKIVVATLPPGVSNSEGHGDVLVAYNAWLSVNWQTFADAVAPVAADSRLSDPTNATYYQADGVHLTAAGNAVVAGIVRPAALSVLPPPSPLPSQVLAGVTYVRNGQTYIGTLATDPDAARSLAAAAVVKAAADAVGSFTLGVSATTARQTLAVVAPKAV